MSHDDGKPERSAEKNRLKAELRQYSEKCERLQRENDRHFKREQELENLLQRTESESRRLHRKLLDQFRSLVLPHVDLDLQAGKMDGSRLFARADFSMLPLDGLERVRARADQEDSYQEYAMLSRPRRSSIDCLVPTGSDNSLMPEYEHLKPALKRQVAANLKNVDKLQNEVQDLRLNNAFLEKQLRKLEQTRAERGLEASSGRKRASQLVTFEEKEQARVLEDGCDELAYRLLGVLRKLINENESAERFSKVDKHTIDSVKEIIYEVSSRCDELKMKLKKA